jgi:hypothetical protein
MERSEPLDQEKSGTALFFTDVVNRLEVKPTSNQVPNSERSRTERKVIYLMDL